MNVPMTLFWPGVLCVALLGFPAVGQARGLVGLSVIDRESGQVLPEVRDQRDHWIAGTPGHRYRVRLTNHSDQRVLAVLSVDGVNAITGETADPAQAGYVIGPWQSADIDGWRKSHQEIAGFVFTDVGDSYASRTGRPRHVGVIGIAVFDEARPARDLHAEHDHGTAPTTAAPRRASSAVESASTARDSAEARLPANPQSIGTGHGDREWSRVSATGFVRASRTPSSVIEVRYDDYQALVARGILPGPSQYRDRPVAFPSGFAADPPRRRR